MSSPRLGGTPRAALSLFIKLTRLEISFIEKRVNLRGKKILDVGCGGGILSEALSNLGAEVTAIDASEETINIAKAHGKEVNSKV